MSTSYLTSALPTHGPATRAGLIEDWTETLHGVTKELELLNRSTEQEFLRIGGKVAGFIETVKLMSGDLTSLGEFISGEQGQEAANALSGALQLSTEMGERAANGKRLLGKMRQDAGSLRNTLSRFSGTVATFHSLGLLTRVETARLGSAGADFGNLAEEVRLLARNVQVRVDSALESASELVPRIESGLQKVEALQEGQVRNLPSVVTRVLESLELFREMQKKAQDASARLGEEYATISNTFQHLIVSMQFNDVTRQQVEHVIEIVGRLCNDRRKEDGKVLLAAHGAADVLELQSSQLSNAEQVFVNSVRSVAQNLSDIAAHVLRMQEGGNDLTGLSGNGVLFHQVESGSSAIVASLNQCAAANVETRTTSENLEKRIRHVRASIHEIRAIETQMRRIAMNARISAEHLGSAGEALSALANAIKQRASESRQMSDTLLETLDAMGETAVSLGESGGTSGDGAGSQGALLENMRWAVAELRHSHEDGSQQIVRIADYSQKLRKQLMDASATFIIDKHFSGVSEKARASLKTIAAEVRNTLADEPGAPALDLAEFVGHYTMREERSVHGGYARAGSPTAEGELSPRGSHSDSVEGDVEFF